jgi:hypothetical protein
MSGARTGVLVLRVWTEPGAPELRARLVESTGTGGRVGSGMTAAGVDGICAAVREWLEPIATAAAVDSDGDVTAH